MRVRVYRNLTKQTYSVQTRVNGRWKVVQYRDFMILTEVKFIVQQAGRERVLTERQKNVHAFVQGTLVENKVLRVGGKISYNPYRTTTFVDTKGKVQHQADCVYLTGEGIYLAEVIE